MSDGYVLGIRRDRGEPPAYVPPPNSLYPTVPYVQERADSLEYPEDQPRENPNNIKGYLDQITNLLSLLHDRVRRNEEKVASMHSTLQQIKTLVQTTDS